MPSRPASMPRHIAVILDGHRRWARDNGQPIAEAYRLGGGKVPVFLDWCQSTGIEVVTLWPLSMDNLRKRYLDQLRGLIAVIQDVLGELAAARRWRIRLMGQLDQLPAEAVTAIRAAERMTADIQGITVNIAIAYDGRAELTSAVRALLRKRATEPDVDREITEEEIAAQLDTHGLPNLDLVIRTSGEQRLSGFLPWESTHAELYFCPTCWPDFGKDDFISAMAWYSNRCRRFGE